MAKKNLGNVSSKLHSSMVFFQKIDNRVSSREWDEVMDMIALMEPFMDDEVYDLVSRRIDEEFVSRDELWAM